MTLEQLANLIGSRKQYVSGVERGQMVPSALRLDEIAKALQVDAGNLLHSQTSGLEKPFRTSLRTKKLTAKDQKAIIWWALSIAESHVMSSRDFHIKEPEWVRVLENIRELRSKYR